MSVDPLPAGTVIVPVDVGSVMRPLNCAVMTGSPVGEITTPVPLSLGPPRPIAQS
jgi:hypothetical protein